MKYFKKFKDVTNKLFNSREKYDLDVDHKSLLLASIFNDLEENGYEFENNRTPISSELYQTGLIWDSDKIPGSFRMWVFILRKLDGVPPLFEELISCGLELVCEVKTFKIRPFLRGGFRENVYQNSDLKRDFPNIEFDPYDPDVVEKIKNFVDQFELKVLK